ncbi:MAG: hypothetical protein EHM45_16640, partial [Desulfobacteraceae bacterium]
MKKLFSVVLLTALFLTLPVLADDFGGPGIGNPGYNQANLTKKDIGAGTVGEDGSYSYSYPMGPFRLSYHSDSGWSWGAGGTIERSTKKGIPQYTLDDTFLLNGQELVQTGHLGANTTDDRYVYTLKRQIGPNVLKAYYYIHNTKNQWVVLHDDGSRAEYSYIIKAWGGKFDGQTYAWGLRDTYSRNNYDHTRYAWRHLGEGQHEIEYIVNGKEKLEVNAKEIIKIEYAQYTQDSQYKYRQISYRTGSRINTLWFPCKVTLLRQTSSASPGSINVSIIDQNYGTYNQVAAWTITEDADFIWHWRVKEIQPEGARYPDNTAFSVPTTVFSYDDNIGNGFGKTYSFPTDYFGVGWPLYPEGLSRYDQTPDVMATYIDMNGDGLPDRVMQENNSKLMIYFNHMNSDGSIYFTNDGTWNSPNNCIKEWNDLGNKTAGHTSDIVDMDGDGLPDRLLKGTGNGTEFWVYPNEGGKKFKDNYRVWKIQDPNGDACAIRESDQAGMWIDLIDMNGDGLLDRVVKNTSMLSFGVKFNTGDGSFKQTEYWPINEPYLIKDGHKHEGDWTYTHNDWDLIDINGDGLPDRVHSYKFADGTYRIMIAFNNGNGFEPYNEFWKLPNNSENIRESVNEADIETHTTLDLMDFNNDGLPDILIKLHASDGSTHPSDLQVYFNIGRGFMTSPVTFSIPKDTYLDLAGITKEFSGNYPCVVASLLDINGDGYPDRLHVRDYSLNMIKPSWHKLIKITDKASGAATDISYQPLNKADNPNYQPSKIVVKEVTVHDGMQTLQGGLPNHYLLRTNYLYGCGVYDSKEREFRGFGCVTEWTQDGSMVKKYYNTDEILKGLIQKTETYARKNDEKDENNLVSRVTNTYQTYVSDKAGWKKSTLILPAKEITQSSGLDGTIRYQTIGHTYSFANLPDFMPIIDIIKSTHYGETDADGTDKDSETLETKTTYSSKENSSPLSFFSYPIEETSQTVKTKYDYYDNGDLKTVSQILDSANALTTSYTYDSYGNVLTVTDPNKQTVTFSYDDYFHQYKRIEKNALGHTAEYQYDPL